MLILFGFCGVYCTVLLFGDIAELRELQGVIDEQLLVESEHNNLAVLFDEVHRDGQSGYSFTKAWCVFEE
jgi:hypothetical protein